MRQPAFTADARAFDFSASCRARHRVHAVESEIPFAKQQGIDV